MYGTQLSDWVNNIRQPFGLSRDQYKGIFFAKNFVKEHSSSNVIFVGHSKGGAEAAAAAVATNKNAVLFNPASVNLSAYGLSANNYTADMIAYIVEGEVINNIFGSLSYPIDQVRYLPYENGDAVDRHMIGSVIDALN